MTVARAGLACEIARGGRALAALLAGVAAAASDVPDEVRAWLREAAIPLAHVEPGHGTHDLAALVEVVGDARVVVLGAPTYGTREVIQVQHRVLEVLVERLGFTALGIEASAPDCRAIDEFVVHGTGDAEIALHDQGFWPWDTDAMLDVIRWMRRRNEAPGRAPPLRLHGVDMQNPAPAVLLACNYLEARGAGDVAALRDRLEPLVDPLVMQRYADLLPIECEDLEASAAELEAHLDAIEPGPGDPDAHAWAVAHHDAVVVRQYEAMIRDAHDLVPDYTTADLEMLTTTVGAASADLLRYVDYVDADLADRARPMLETLGGDAHAVLEAYRQVMTPEERDGWDETIESVGRNLQMERDTYLVGSSEAAQGRAATAATEIGRFLTLCRAMLDVPAGRPRVRDAAMAANARWILDQGGPDARIVVWTHALHASRASAELGAGAMGAELVRALGDDVVIIACMFDRGSFQAFNDDGGTVSLRPFSVGPAPAGSIERALGDVGLPRFLVDLRGARRDGPVRAWLDAPRPQRLIGTRYLPAGEASFFRARVVSDHYDAVVFIDDTTRARPGRLTRPQFGLPEPPVRPGPESRPRE